MTSPSLLWLAQRNFRRRINAALGRWTHWEFWPGWLFYLPVAVNYVRLAILYRDFTLPTAANPGIFSGGFVGESKIVPLRDLQATSPEFLQQTTPTGTAHRSIALLSRRKLVAPV